MKVVFVLLTVLAAVSAGCGGGGGMAKMVMCNGEKPDYKNPIFMDPAKECHGENSGESDKKQMFIKTIMCILKKLGILNGDKLDGGMIKKHLNTLYPENGKKLHSKVVEPCLTPENNCDLDPENLPSFMKVGGCMKGPWMKTCGIKMGGGGQGCCAADDDC